MADDHPLFLLGLKRGLEEAGVEVVAAVSDGRLAVEACRRSTPEWAILDVRMPSLNGIEACRTIVAAGTCNVVVILTTWLDAHVVRAAKEAGARALLSKEHRADYLVAVANRLLGDPRLEIFPSNDAPELSDREMQVLDGIAQGFTRKRIALELGISPETVKDYVASLFAKLDAHDRVTVVTQAVSRGVMPLPPSGGGEPRS